MRANFVHLCGTAMALVIAVPAAAQTSNGSDEQGADTPSHQSGIQTIVVTAQKRVENVQDVPIAISAFGGDQLQDRAVGEVSELAALAPNVSLDSSVPFSGSTAVLAAYIRGIGSDDFAFNIDPGVGIYVDGVYLARSVGANQDLLDVERIEILKGPQGTLFGRNTIGGAISIVTRDPADEFRFRGDVTVGSYNRMQGRGSVDIPLTENLYSSLTFNVSSRNGFVKRVPFPDDIRVNTPSFRSYAAADYKSPDTEGDQDNRTVRGKLLYDLGSSFRVTLNGDYTYSAGGAASTLLQTTANVPGPFVPPAGLAIPGTAFDPTETQGVLFAGVYNFCIGSTPQEIAARNAAALCAGTGTQFPSQAFGKNTPVTRVPGFGSVNVDSDPNNDRLPYDDRFLSSDIDRSYATGNSFSRLKNWGIGAVIDLDITPDIALKSISAYRDQSWQSGADLDGSPINSLQVSFDQRQWQISEELQLTGTLLDDRLDFVLGAYYFKEKGSLHDYVTFAEGLLQVDGPNRLETENYAAFGQIDFRPIDLIGVTLGGRYTHENKSFEGGQQDLNGFNYRLFGCADGNGDITPDAQAGFAPPGVTCQAALSYPDPNNPIRVYPPGENKLTFNDFSPKIGLQLYPADDIMLYGSWSRGYKTGGWTTRFSNPQLQAQSYDPEEAETWEVGFKSTLLDRRLQINAAAFSTDYSNIQLNYQNGTSPTIGNVGDARIKGFEIETVTQPVDWFLLNASMGYTDATYTELDPLVSLPSVSGPNPLQAGAVIGARLPKTPEWQFNISPVFTFDLANGSQLTIVGDYSHSSKLYNDVARTYLLTRGPTDIVNASVTYDSPDRVWSLSVGGNNILDERYITTGQNNAAGGSIFGTYNRPATWYIRLGVDI
ncbi:TonB-dependent receptor [Altericroceibacterium endophyticum]|uniref:TonB-dependent receptor n=1 Tax=Altericroceibacterium endophyticum TaxID=1808508 RepID=A0A6I4T3V0_9SPHN|nr:TonB-dependent receptor [Altericroceibacterium endophyticum]MXO64821.1 TonB-dependent receptor [Altericroceibacterium endophyticum]